MIRRRSIAQAGEVRSSRIEALRAFAALSVLIFHVRAVSLSTSRESLDRQIAVSGRLGVYLFFALTGYLVYVPFARAMGAAGAPMDLRRYARNRALRILPLYWFVVAFLLIVEHGGGTGTQWWRFMTFTESFFRDTVGTLDTPLWSLAVEIQFYILLPLLAWALYRLSRGSAKGAAVLLGVLGAASLAVWWLKTVHTPSADLRWAYSFPATFYAFVPGMLIALIVSHRSRVPSRAWPSGSVLVVAGIACWALSFLDQGLGPALAAPASMLVLAGVVLPARDGWLTAPLEWRALGLVGVASYSLYLWHVPIIQSLERHTHAGFRPLLATSVIGSLLVAGASYRVVERPFLALRTRWGPTIASDARPTLSGDESPRTRPVRHHRRDEVRRA